MPRTRWSTPAGTCPSRPGKPDLPSGQTAAARALLGELDRPGQFAVGIPGPVPGRHPPSGQPQIGGVVVGGGESERRQRQGRDAGQDALEVGDRHPGPRPHLHLALDPRAAGVTHGPVSHRTRAPSARRRARLIASSRRSPCTLRSTQRRHPVPGAVAVQFPCFGVVAQHRLEDAVKPGPQLAIFDRERPPRPDGRGCGASGRPSRCSTRRRPDRCRSGRCASARGSADDGTHADVAPTCPAHRAAGSRCPAPSGRSAPRRDAA